MAVGEDRLWRYGIFAWTIFAVVIVIVLPIATPNRSLIPLYSEASENFWLGIDRTAQYYYLPASQIAFTPFALLGNWLGGALWRLLAIALLTIAMWQWARLLVIDRPLPAFGANLLLLIFGAAGALRNGQFDAPMWALVMIAAGKIARGRDWPAAIALALAVVLKPQAIAAVLLMGFVWPRVGVRLLPLVLAVLALPFVFADYEFVVRLYVNLVHSIGEGVQQPGDWNDLHGMLAKFGYTLSYPVMTGIRVAAAFAALILAMASRRLLPRLEAAFSTFALFALFILLFNPREEGSGYIGLALVCAPIAARAVLQERRLLVGAMLIAVCVVLGITGLTSLLLSLLGVWLKPLMACVVGVGIVVPRTIRPVLWTTLPDRACANDQTTAPATQ